MNFPLKRLRELLSTRRSTERPRIKRTRVAVSFCDMLEDRVVLSHVGGIHHHIAVHHHGANTSTSTKGTSSTGTTGTSTTSSSTTTTGITTTGSSTTTSSSANCGSGSTGGSGDSSNSTLQAARKTLQTDVQTIEAKSGTTVGELTTLNAAFQTLQNDGLYPSSISALKSFEDSLVTAAASGTTLSGNSTLLSQFEAIYTSSPTTQQSLDLQLAYNALTAAVTSANITSSDISTIDTDFAAVQSAMGNTSSTATFPYFNLVVGGGALGGDSHGGFGGGFDGYGGYDEGLDGSSSSSSSALTTLRSDIQTIKEKSGTTVGQLTTLNVAFQTLQSDGLRPSSVSALKSFENSLVTAAASGTTLSGNSSLLSQFEAIYSSSPTTQQTTDLTAAYEALASAVTSADITSSDISTINTDFSAVLSALGDTSSTATFPYFSLVVGGGFGGGFGIGLGGFGGDFGGHGGGFGGHGRF